MFVALDIIAFNWIAFVIAVTVPKQLATTINNTNYLHSVCECEQNLLEWTLVCRVFRRLPTFKS
jgi:hypothetical protein